MKNNKLSKKDQIVLTVVLLVAVSSFILTLFSQHLFFMCLLGIATLLLVSQLKKMNIKL